ncbi:cupin domain-containing protein [Mycobacterium sp. 852002-10029_SCH5224772]|uniref:cupin domain-containing protein n=1 Tax=Mycobacterium sp. 852002-10029_SCH5224772 TaxID=1834083 RepID=UPI0007FF13FD|nr:cupin domain-containing protein [Mycobacterium sp. 852002-10029_SCH5224772]OBE94139.1 cupin [Mycobacterium sp. 852002-10029_SCH5224772]
MQFDNSTVFCRLAEESAGEALDVLGPTIEFLTWSEDFCVMRGVVPPGVTVPLHRHDDAEDFFIISGTQQVLVESANGLEWRDAHAGDYVRIPGHVPHAHRNISDQPAIEVIVTSARLGRFFQEVGVPATDSPQPPTAERLKRFVQAAEKYGYVLGTPEENAAVGIEVPAFTG